MCSSYKLPVISDYELFLDCLPPAEIEFEPVAYPGYRAPMITQKPGQSKLIAQAATFGLVPAWAKDMKITRSTYNARSESVADKPSFRTAWKKRQFCLVPVAGFYEPNYATGKPVRWQIRRADDLPFTLAGLREWKRLEDGIELRSFTMLTVNATEHPLMRRFHAPEDEKRSVVYVAPEDRMAWLNADTDEEARSFLRLMDPDEFIGVEDPAPPRKRRAE